MTLLLNRKAETNPSISKRIGSNIQGECYSNEVIEGKFYRVFPINLNDIKFIQSLEKYIDVFPPAIGNGDGIFIKARFLDEKQIQTTAQSLKLKCVTEAKANELGYTPITTKISVDSEQSIILSMQESMRGRNAVWIVTGKNNENNTGLYVQLAILNESLKED